MPDGFFIPQNITVHLGAPDDTSASNVTVLFTDYIKNVASSEIYPTWPSSAIRANIYAQISFALNRVFTEHYRSRGYNFDITNNTRFDQAFVNGRDIFDNISRIVDELFNDYIVRPDDLTPLFARYCNGTTSLCPGGLSQWGSVSLAEEGYTPYRILTSYYGDINIVEDAPVGNITESYPGTPLRIGSEGNTVKRLQLSLNRITKNYPAIPKIAFPDGIFDVTTENSVKEFQRIFNLTPDGIVGKATWYKVIFIYNGTKRLSELDSEGISVSALSSQFKSELKEGDSGTEVLILQYYLNFIAEFNDFIPAVNSDGFFGEQTASSVSAFQKSVGLAQTGIVDKTTWDAIYSSYITKYNALPPEFRTGAAAPYPGEILQLGDTGEAVSTIQRYLSKISDTYPSVPKIEVTGIFDSATQDAVLAYEREFNLPERGFVNLTVWNSIANLYSDLTDGEQKSFGQFPGYTPSEDINILQS